MVKDDRIPVMFQAVIERINRKLQTDQKTLKTTHTESMRRQVGDYYVLDFFQNRIAQKDVDPEEYARVLGVLHAWEKMTREGNQ